MRQYLRGNLILLVTYSPNYTYTTCLANMIGLFFKSNPVFDALKVIFIWGLNSPVNSIFPISWN